MLSSIAASSAESRAAAALAAESRTMESAGGDRCAMRDARVASESAGTAGRVAGVADGSGAGAVLGAEDDAQDAMNSAIPSPAQLRMAFPVQGGSASQVGSSATEPALVFQ